MYTYDAAGTKLRKTVSGVTTDYAEGGALKKQFVTVFSERASWCKAYQNNQLQFFNQPEGYVEPNGSGGFNYVYQYKDHLGNIRLSYTDVNQNNSSAVSLIIKEENNYYPFGLKQKGYNATINGRHHKYMFGGKEQQDELGLNWYDITARNYDPALGRWMNLDPLAELMTRHSPYNYAFDNPIFFIDTDGMAPFGNYETREDNSHNHSCQDITGNNCSHYISANASSGPGDPPTLYAGTGTAVGNVVNQLPEVVLNSRSSVNSTETDAYTPGTWTSSFNGTLADWNSQNGVNFSSHREAYNWFAANQLAIDKAILVSKIHKAQKDGADMLVTFLSVVNPWAFAFAGEELLVAMSEDVGKGLSKGINSSTLTYADNAIEYSLIKQIPSSLNFATGEMVSEAPKLLNFGRQGFNTHLLSVPVRGSAFVTNASPFAKWLAPRLAPVVVYGNVRTRIKNNMHN